MTGAKGEAPSESRRSACAKQCKNTIVLTCEQSIESKCRVQKGMVCKPSPEMLQTQIDTTEMFQIHVTTPEVLLLQASHSCRASCGSAAAALKKKEHCWCSCMGLQHFCGVYRDLEHFWTRFANRAFLDPASALNRLLTYQRNGVLFHCSAHPALGGSLGPSSSASVPRVYHGDGEGDGEGREGQVTIRPKHLLSSHYSEFASCQHVRVCLSAC